MKNGKKTQSILVIALGTALVLWALPSFAEEVRFLKVRFAGAQEALGRAFQDSARLRFVNGSAQEDIGRVIRDSGVRGKIDQAAFGREIAKRASLNWQKGVAQERLGSAIVKSAHVVFSEKAIMGRIQKQFGKMSLAVSRPYPISPETLRASAQRRAARLQEDLGGRIATRARLNWAEEELTRAVQTSLRSARIPEALSERFDEGLSLIRNGSGSSAESNLRMGFALLESQMGRPLLDLLPAPMMAQPSPGRYTEAGWGGFWEFGFPSLAGFFAVMGMFSWVLRDLDRLPSTKRLKADLTKAA